MKKHYGQKIRDKSCQSNPDKGASESNNLKFVLIFTADITICKS